MTERTIDWAALLLGAFFVILGILAVANPGASLFGFMVLFACLAIIRGCYGLYLHYKMKELTGFRSGLLIFTCILDIFIGLMIFIRPVAGLLFLAYMFAFWFLFDGIGGLVSMDVVKRFSKFHYWLNIIISILAIILGIYLLFNPNLSLVTLTFFISVFCFSFGILFIFAAFRRRTV